MKDEMNTLWMIMGVQSDGYKHFSGPFDSESKAIDAAAETALAGVRSGAKVYVLEAVSLHKALPDLCAWHIAGTEMQTFRHEGISVAASVEREHSLTTGRWRSRIRQLGTSAYGDTIEDAEEKLHKMFATWIHLHREAGTLGRELDRSGLKWWIGGYDQPGEAQAENPIGVVQYAAMMRAQAAAQVATTPRPNTVINSVKKGCEDIKLGRVKPWEDIKKDIGGIPETCPVLPDNKLRCYECGRLITTAFVGVRYCKPCCARKKEKPLTYPAPTEPGYYWAQRTQSHPRVIVEVLPELNVDRMGRDDPRPRSDFAIWGPRIPEWKGQ